jgi:leader peptidase (prepilin peptidase)/N-methyltransferase
MITILVGFIGLLSGMLVNYLADVLPVKRQFVKPLCVYCFESQPLLNYFFWPRRCQVCRSRRPWRVWIVEALFIGISLWLWFSPAEKLGYRLGMVLMFYFAVVVIIDLEHRLIMHPVSWVGAGLGLGVGWYLHGLLPTLIGGAAGYGLMLGMYYFGQLFSRWLSQRRGEAIPEEALGFGDVNLSGVLGLLLGWPGILAGLVIAVMLGGAVSLVYILLMVISRRYRMFAAIPYGPFLVMSALYLLFLKDLMVGV